MRTSAAVTITSAVLIDGAIRGTRSDATAASTSSTAAGGTEKDSLERGIPIKNSLPFAHWGHNSEGKTVSADAPALHHPALWPRRRACGGRCLARDRRRDVRIADRERHVHDQRDPRHSLGPDRQGPRDRDRPGRRRRLDPDQRG